MANKRQLMVMMILSVSPTLLSMIILLSMIMLLLMIILLCTVTCNINVSILTHYIIFCILNFGISNYWSFILTSVSVGLASQLPIEHCPNLGFGDNTCAILYFGYERIEVFLFINIHQKVHLIKMAHRCQFCSYERCHESVACSGHMHFDLLVDV